MKIKFWPPVKSEEKYYRNEWKARQELLIKGIRNKRVDKGNGVPQTLAELMEQLMDFIHICFWIRHNPLPHLRRYFPDFHWEFIKPKDTKEILLYVSTSDYIWPDDNTGDWSTGMIIAVRKRAGFTTFRNCFVPEHIDAFAIEAKELKKTGVKFIH